MCRYIYIYIYIYIEREREKDYIYICMYTHIVMYTYTYVLLVYCYLLFLSSRILSQGFKVLGSRVGPSSWFLELLALVENKHVLVDVTAFDCFRARF